MSALMEEEEAARRRAERGLGHSDRRGDRRRARCCVVRLPGLGTRSLGGWDRGVDRSVDRGCLWSTIELSVLTASGRGFLR